MSLLTNIITLIHSWYPPACCGGSDCKPIPCKELIPQADGTFKYLDLIFSSDMVKGSIDGMCHVCISAAHAPLCMFIPPGA